MAAEGAVEFAAQQEVARHRKVPNRDVAEGLVGHGGPAWRGPVSLIEPRTSRVARGQGNGVFDGFDCWLQRFRKSSAGCLMPWRSVRTCGLASK